MPTRVSQPPGKSLSPPLASTSLEVGVLSSDGVGDVLITPWLSSMVAAAQIHVSDKVDDARYELSAMSDDSCLRCSRG